MGQSTEELTSQIEDTRQRMASDLDTLQDRVSPSAIVERRKQAVRGGISSMKDKVMGTAQSATGSMSSATSSMAGSVTGTVSDAGSTVTSTAQDRFEGAPLAAGLVAFGAGVVLASVLPASRLEAEAAHRVVEGAKEQAQPMIGQARAVGEQLGSDIANSAADSAAQVKQSAQQSAQTVAGEAQSSTESVRDQAQG
jgi:Protein of unknown function (DUF3618)